MKRKDTYGRTLRKGETQLKNGGYTYRKTKNGKQIIAIYAPTLEALRTKEKSCQLEAAQGIDIAAAKNFTINDAYQRYFKPRTDLKYYTVQNAQRLFHIYIENSIGKKRMKDVKYSDVVAFYMDILTYRSPGTVGLVHSLLSVLYKAAIRDRLITYNPVTGAITEAKKKANKTTTNKPRALTETEQEIFVNYTMEFYRDNTWTPLIIFLLGTGCRMGEASALTWNDVNFNSGEYGEIHINKSMGRKQDGSLFIGTPKTASGVRTIPILKEVREALVKQRERQFKNGGCVKTVDGYSDFVFLSPRRYPAITGDFNGHLKTIVKNYNKDEKEAAQKLHREPVYLPTFSAHTFRHTFASRIVQSGMNLKTVQTIMGHADIKTTLNIYTEVSDEHKHDEFKALEDKIQITRRKNTEPAKITKIF